MKKIIDKDSWGMSVRYEADKDSWWKDSKESMTDVKDNPFKPVKEG